MYLEEKQIKKFKINNWNAKEWWYSGCYDESLGIYFSFFFIRTNTLDSFNFTLFDPKLKEPKTYTQYLILDSKQEKNKLDLSFKSKEATARYYGDETTGWQFIFKNRYFDIDIKIKKTIPRFTKFDNNFINIYTLLHYMQNTVDGTLSVDGSTYRINNALGYYDHCFGIVPRRTGWHWVAVQNRNAAFVSLVNYGAYAQKYTHVFLNSGKYSGRWIRLNQDVSFEYDPQRKTSTQWKLTSCDIELEMTPMMHTESIKKVPPVIPLLFNLTHYEFYVKIGGNVRIDGEWIKIDNLFGVLEEHYGIW